MSCDKISNLVRSPPVGENVRVNTDVKRAGFQGGNAGAKNYSV